MISEWAVILTEEGATVNYYGPCTVAVKLLSGTRLTLKQITEYPRDGEVALQVGLKKPERFVLSVRIPCWSAKTRVSVNGRTVRAVEPGTYLALNRTWKNGDVVKLLLDMSLHFWAGEKEVADKASIYRGPILLAYDQRYNSMDPDDIPTLDSRNLEYGLYRWEAWPQPWILLRFKAHDGRSLVLCDFASAGATGTQYRSWLPIEGVKPRVFTRKTPVWISRP